MKKSVAHIVSKNLNSVGILLLNISYGISFAKPDIFSILIESGINEGKLPKEAGAVERC